MAELAQVQAQSHAQMWTWNNLTEADTDPKPVVGAARSDCTLRVSGTFNGGTVIFEGALQTKEENEAAPDWFPLNDIDGNPISMTAAGTVVRRENVLLMRPRVTAGAGVDVTARVLLTGNR